MSDPKTLAEAQAQCRALGVDLRVPMPSSGPRTVNGHPMPISACMDLLFPFCPGGAVRAEEGEELPRCVSDAVSPAKAAVLLAEAQARASSGEPPWLLIGAGVLALGGLAYWLAKK